MALVVSSTETTSSTKASTDRKAAPASSMAAKITWPATISAPPVSTPARGETLRAFRRVSRALFADGHSDV